MTHAPSTRCKLEGFDTVRTWVAYLPESARTRLGGSGRTWNRASPPGEGRTRAGSLHWAVLSEQAYLGVRPLVAAWRDDEFTSGFSLAHVRGEIANARSINYKAKAHPATSKFEPRRTTRIIYQRRNHPCKGIPDNRSRCRPQRTWLFTVPMPSAGDDHSSAASAGN